MKNYKKLTPATIAAFGGKFIVRGGQTITLEGRLETGENCCSGISLCRKGQ